MIYSVKIDIQPFGTSVNINIFELKEMIYSCPKVIPNAICFEGENVKIRHQNFSGFRIAVQRIRFNQFQDDKY